MLELRSVSNLEDVIGALTELEAKQVPFALSLALNRTAAEGQAAVRDRMPERFTLRKDWTRKGIRTTLATPRSLRSVVYTKDWYMEDQETGGIRRPQKAPSLFIPTLAIRKGGSIEGLPSKRPKTLLKQAKAPRRGRKKYRRDGSYTYRKPTAFFVPEGKDLPSGIYIRRYADKRLPIVMLYRSTDRAKVPARWGFRGTVEGVSDKRLRRAFIEALDQALKTAKGGPVKSAYVEHLVEHDGVTGRISAAERAIVTARQDRLHNGGMGSTLANNRP